MSPTSLDIDTLSRDIITSLLDAMPVSVILIENEDVFCNRASEKITGYDREEIASLHDFFTKIFGDGSRLARTQFDADRTAGFPASREYATIGRDGRTRVLEIAGSGSGRTSRALCSLQDVTNYCRPEHAPFPDSPVGQSAAEPVPREIIARDALRVSEERYRFLSELTSDYVHYCTRSGSDPFRVR
jgi:PAS domain S-box-containing protein